METVSDIENADEPLKNPTDDGRKRNLKRFTIIVFLINLYIFITNKNLLTYGK